MRRRRQPLMRLALLMAVLVWPIAASVRLEAQVKRNASRYGSTFYWWYDRLPATTKYPPTIAWDANDPRWWRDVITQAKAAGLGWLAPNCWGQGSSADPITLGPLLTAIKAVSPSMKIALFDDTTSHVLRKNLAKGRGWTLDERFDLSDLAGTAEGGLHYFYDQQWKRFFQTIPPAQRLTINGRPVVIMWAGGYAWYTRTNFFHSMVDALRAATRRDFNVDPFIIVEQTWMELDPATGADAVYAWFDPARGFATQVAYNGVRIGHVVPGFDTSLSSTPHGYLLERQGGAVYYTGLQAAAAGSDLVFIEGLNNVDENAHLVETTTWGKLYLTITKWFASNVP